MLQTLTPFFEVKQRWVPFLPGFSGILPWYLGILPGFSGILSRFSGILPGLSTNQNFWGCACTHCTPASYTTILAYGCFFKVVPKCPGGGCCSTKGIKIYTFIAILYPAVRELTFKVIMRLCKWKLAVLMMLCSRFFSVSSHVHLDMKVCSVLIITLLMQISSKSCVRCLKDVVLEVAANMSIPQC